MLDGVSTTAMCGQDLSALFSTPTSFAYLRIFVLGSASEQYKSEMPIGSVLCRRSGSLFLEQSTQWKLSYHFFTLLVVLHLPCRQRCYHCTPKWLWKRASLASISWSCQYLCVDSSADKASLGDLNCTFHYNTPPVLGVRRGKLHHWGEHFLPVVQITCGIIS